MYQISLWYIGDILTLCSLPRLLIISQNLKPALQEDTYYTLQSWSTHVFVLNLLQLGKFSKISYKQQSSDYKRNNSSSKKSKDGREIITNFWCALTEIDHVSELFSKFPFSHQQQSSAYQRITRSDPKKKCYKFWVHLWKCEYSLLCYLILSLHIPTAKF